jgi:hypothetical protein
VLPAAVAAATAAGVLCVCRTSTAVLKQGERGPCGPTLNVNIITVNIIITITTIIITLNVIIIITLNVIIIIM